MNVLSHVYGLRNGRGLAVHAIGIVRRRGLSCASRLLGMRWAARWIATRLDREGWIEGRPTVLCLRRALFAKDIENLRERCDLNFVCLSQGHLGRLQHYWISHDLTRQTHYQCHRGPEYDQDWERLEKFGHMILSEVEKIVPFDAIMTANIDYWQDQGIRMAARKCGQPFLVLRREHECSVFTRLRAKKRYTGFTFEGDCVAAFGQESLQLLIDSGACREGQVVVTGAPRFDNWHDIDQSNDDADTLVLLSYLAPGYRAQESFREVLELFVKHAENAHSTSMVRFVVKAKSSEDARLISRMLKAKPKNLSIEHDIGLYDLLRSSRLVIGFDSLSLLEALLSDATVVIPFWGVTNVEADQVMFHPCREPHGTAINFVKSLEALSNMIDCAVLNEQRHQVLDRNTRLEVVNQMVAWLPQKTASEAVEDWIRSAIASSRSNRLDRPVHSGTLWSETVMFDSTKTDIPS